MVRQAVKVASFSAFVDEMVKIAIKAPSLSILSKGSPFSSNAATKPSTIKHVVSPIGGSAGKVIPPAQTGATAIRPPSGGRLGGVNLRTPTVVDPKLPLTKGTPPASPVHVAPQVNPQAATIRQGAPQTVNSAAPTAGGAGAPQAPAPSGGSQSMAQRR